MKILTFIQFSQKSWKKKSIFCWNINVLFENDYSYKKYYANFSHFYSFFFFSKILKKQLSVWMMLLIQRIQIHKWTQTKIKFWFLKQVMLKYVYKSIKIEFEYDSRVKNISKHTLNLHELVYRRAYTGCERSRLQCTIFDFTLVYLSYLLIK